jgi:predicted ArsR family transcriptional regulator
MNGPARSSDPLTSVLAGQSVDVPAREMEVYAFLRGAGLYGATSSEIADALGLGRDSVSPRMKGLVKRGLVAPSGTRTNASGRKAIVWVAVGAGRTT